VGQHSCDRWHAQSENGGGRPGCYPRCPTDESAALSGARQWTVSADPAQQNRRWIYIVNRRNFPYPMFEAFDSPENAISCPNETSLQ
jgi:hypothetical protein